ncbi:hypothetical protein ACGFSI_34855 [Streptomyces virginiae]|uniref:hypothetical protein n=1 Tax=Streptomyces virginiae TaxID=1961 RepID=UPI00371066AD
MKRFEGGEKNREIAAVLRVSERSVERWRRCTGASAARTGSCRRVLPGGARGSGRSRLPGWSESVVHGGGCVAAAEAARLVMAAVGPPSDRAR